MARATEAHPACRFYVEIDGAKQAVFTEVGGVTLEVAVEDVEEGGNNSFVHRLPGRCKFGNLTLKRGLATSNEFFKWSLDVAQGKFTRKNLSIILYNVDGTEFMRWTFTNAYPVKWTGPQFKSDDSATAIETVELAHEGLKKG